MDINKKIEDFKKLFYSDLTEAEIKEVLNINYKEYKQLLNQVKQELGLPTYYRRKPKRYWKYNSESYYILKKLDNDFEIISYCPTEEVAEVKVNNMNDDYEYIIDKATDDNLLNLIRDEYVDKKNNWEGIMRKCKLPYHKFYYLLNIIKTELGKTDNAVCENRFVYKYTPTKKFVIKKYIDGRYVTFGYYDDEKSAYAIRNYLEEINWDIDLWNDNKSNVVGELLNE